MHKKKLLAGLILSGLLFGILSCIGFAIPIGSMGAWLRYICVASGLVFFVTVVCYILLVWQVK